MINLRLDNRARFALAGLLFLAACGEDALALRPAYLDPSTDILDFGDQEIGSGQTELSINLLNKGETALTLKEPTGDLLGGVFGVQLDANEALARKDVVARFFFEPLDEIGYETQVVIPNNSTNRRDFIVTLRGSGLAGQPCAAGCTTPPPDLCLNRLTRRSYDPIGYCDLARNMCVYDPFDEPCEFGCNPEIAWCRDDPCIGVQCDNPPNECFYAADAQCVNGACVYNARDGICSDGDLCTINDTCQFGSCLGERVVCDSPPPSYCADSFTLRTFEPIGACDPGTGNCRYLPRDTSCEFGCSGAACQGNQCLPTCDDGRECTTDYCIDPAIGCAHDVVVGAPCVSNSSNCPVGACTVGGTCLPVTGEICSTSVQLDLCGSVDVAGVCTGAGRCEVTEPPADYACGGGGGIAEMCLCCTIIPGFEFRVCIPLI